MFFAALLGSSIEMVDAVEKVRFSLMPFVNEYYLVKEKTSAAYLPLLTMLFLRLLDSSMILLCGISKSPSACSDICLALSLVRALYPREAWHAHDSRKQHPVPSSISITIKFMKSLLLQ